MNHSALKGLAYGGFWLLGIALIVGVILYPVPGMAVLGSLIAAVLLARLPADKVALYCGCAALTLLMLVPVQNIAGFGNLKIGVLAAVAALAVFAVVRRFRSISKRPWGLWLFVAYFGVLALATPRSDEPSAWNLFLGIAVSGLSLAVLFALMTRKERAGALSFIVFLASCEAMYAIFELVAKRPPLWGYASVGASGAPNLMLNQIDTALVRSQGTMGHPLPLALLLLVGLALAIRSSGPRNPVVRWIVIAVLFAGCFASGSRSAMAVALVLVFLGAGRKNRTVTIAAGGLLMLIGWLMAVYAGILESEAFTRFEGSSSVSHRAGALDAVPGLLTEQTFVNMAFGNGYFSAYQVFRAGLLQVGNFFAVDNQMVMTLTEAGVVGVLVLAGLVIRSIARIGVDARLGLLSIVVFFFSFDVLSWPSGMALFGAFVGMAFSASSTPSAADTLVSPQEKVSL